MNEQNTTPNDSTAPENPYWLTLEQHEDPVGFAKRAESEFLSSPFASEDGKDGFARRDFLKLMGASIAMATTACVRRPVEKIIPYAQNPEGHVAGIPNFYASTWYDGVEGYGLLVKTMDGRPIKLEGNPNHPMNLGSLPARAHAEVLSLYDPDRLRAPSKNLQNKNRTNREPVSAKWEDIDTAVLEALGKGGVAILSSTLPQPSTRALIGDFQKSYGNARWVQYDSIPVDAILEAQRRSYGRAAVPRYRFEQAKLIVSIDADFLGAGVGSAEANMAWAKLRKPGPDMGRMVSFESVLTLTGMNADDRIRIRASQQFETVMALAAAAAKASGSVPADLQAYSNVAGLDTAAIAKVGAELWANRGKSLVIAGQMPTANAVEVQMAVNSLNSFLGNDGKTVDSGSASLTRQGSTADLRKLIADMAAGTIKTLIIHNLNAAYVLPADYGFLAALAKVPFVVYTGNFNDETGQRSDFVLPAGNSLESWGDYELQSGVYSIQQPTIRPLWDTRSFEDSLLAWTQKAGGAPARAKNAKNFFEYLQGVARAEYAKQGSFDTWWADLLQKGVVDARRAAGAGRTASGGWPKSNVKALGDDTYELSLYATSQLADGRYANVAWMQELPDPVTKIVWDNYLMVAPATARKENLKDGDVVSLSFGKDRSVKVPVLVQPGTHDKVFGLSIGYGRTAAGRVGNGIGINAYDLAQNGQFAGLPVTMKKTGEKYQLVSAQGHHIMEQNRHIIAETTNDLYQKNPSSGIHRHHVFSIWPEHKYNKHRWAMAIDLNACTGCSACVIACQSENNIPVVGKKYVMQGREMHWIRVDRYYRGSADNPDSVFQPLTCQQCETAPCETVCPVLATVHSDEGLNDMVYNRCVGTRYCSNNCPYKVRRFNWFNYSKREAPLHMALNPEVTVRSRGVMEKCTFCVHRIRAVTTGIGQTTKPAKIADGSIKTACQETCPTGAIVFGDLNDPASQVRKLVEDKRAYALLDDLNTQPRVRYMSKIRSTGRVVGDALTNPDDHEEAGPAHGTGETGHGTGTTNGKGSQPEGHGANAPAAAPAAAPAHDGKHGFNMTINAGEHA